VKCGLMHNLLAALAVPPHTVNGVFRSLLLEHDADGVGKADRVVGCVWREEEHVAFPDDDVSEDNTINHFEYHGALVLVEPLGRLVDVVIRPSVGATDDLGILRAMQHLEGISQNTITVKSSL